MPILKLALHAVGEGSRRAGDDFSDAGAVPKPFLAANFGGVYGPGVQDGFVAGPEIGFNIDLIEGIAMRAKVAYDYQFRNAGHLDEVFSGLGFGIGF